MVKETSIVGYISVQDLTMVSDIIHSRTMEAFFPLLVTAMIYLIIANMLTTVLDIIEIKIDPKHGKRTVKGVKMQ
jgi:polar amino acid transport system substrate-binding protein